MNLIMNIKPYWIIAARNSGKPGKEIRPSSKSVDAHCHLHVQEAAVLVQGLFDQQDVPAFRHANQTTTYQNT